MPDSYSMWITCSMNVAYCTSMQLAWCLESFPLYCMFGDTDDDILFEEDSLPGFIQASISKIQGLFKDF